MALPISWDAFAAWLAEHGLDADQVESLELVRQDAGATSGIVLRATVYALDSSGNRYVAGDEVALDTKHVLVARLPDGDS